MGTLWIRALGPLVVIADGASVSVSSGKLRTVLECLALRANTVVGADFLAEVLWDGRPPAHPLPQLQVYIANLRSLLEPARPKGCASQRLASRPGGYLLAVVDDELDLLQFRRQVAAGARAVQAGNLAGGARHLRQAVELFNGPVFPDLADIELMAADLDGLEESRLDAYQDLFDIELALGRHAALIGELQRLVPQHPFRERLRASLVLALYRSDRQADALAACREARETFTTELGIDLGVRLRELETLVLRQDPSLNTPAVQGQRRSRQRLDNLPAALTPLVGRENELGEVCSLYRSEDCRLVTVTGAGGTGKTRLALAAAARLRERMADGVGWVNLAPLTQVQQVPGAIASTLGLEAGAGDDPLKIASRFLHRRRLLLVLDNFEHLEDAWPVVLDMLTAAPELRILTTSRRRLGLRPEYEFELAPLKLPSLEPPLPPRQLREVPAVKLLVNRGRSVRPHFDVNDGNTVVVTRLCHRLDGLPLAIELAAAQLRRLDERALLAELEVSLAAMPAAFRDLPDRQRTLTATMEWSYQLLPDAERLLFDRIGVFAGDPTVTAIGAVCGQTSAKPLSVDDVLSALAAHSLVRRYSDYAGRQRVSVLHSIREFARNRLLLLNDAADVRRRHAEHYLSLAEALGPQLWGRDQVEAFRTLHSDAPDLRAALLWAAGPDGSTELALRLVGQLWHYWEITGDVAEQQGIAVALVEAAPDAPPELRGPALSGAATLCWALGRYDQAANLHGLALQAFRETSNSPAAAWTMMCLAVQAAYSGKTSKARQLAADVLAAPDASLRTRISVLVLLSRLAFFEGDHQQALDLSRRCVEVGRPIGDRSLLGVVLTNLAECAEQSCDYDAAERLLHEAVDASLELSAQSNLVAVLESLAGVYAAQNRLDPAIRLLAAANAYRLEHGRPLDGEEAKRVEAITARARAEAGPIRFGLAWAGGRALTVTQAANELVQGGRGRGGINTAPAESTEPIPASRTQFAADDPPDPAPW
jgi:predicted ATPase/DNA-binding SARP family transcriptional activator